MQVYSMYLYPLFLHCFATLLRYSTVKFTGNTGIRADRQKFGGRGAGLLRREVKQHTF
jgi:hypothetical protein